MLYPETLYVDFGYKESPPLKEQVKLLFECESTLNENNGL